jgi:arylsulfatase A-like enzyme
MPLTRRCFLGALALPALAKKIGPEHPNVLLILVDNLPAWILGPYGNREVKTPHLDQLAKTGTRFSNAFACTPAPALSRATLLTGRTPMQLGDSEERAASDNSLEKLFADAGYTVHSVGAGGAAPWLEQQSSGKPFFLTAHFAHFEPPYDNVEPKYRDLYAQVKFDTLNLDRTAARNAQRGKEMLGNIIGSMRKAAAAVTAIDDELGSMIAKLSGKRLLDNTLVIFTSSCGSLLGRHGLWDSGQASDPINMYEESVAIPLIWSWLGRVPALAVRPEPVSTYDFVPTLCDATGASAPSSNLCGRSYLPLATGKPLPKKQPWRKTVFGHYRNTDMARIEQYKLVMRDGGKGPGEIYDLIADPYERQNQYDNPQFLTVKTTLSQSLAAWKQRYSG